MCREINNYDPFIKEELPKAAGDWFRTVHGDSIFVVKNTLFAVFDIYKILIIGWNVDIDCKFTIMYVNFWIAWFSSCSIMWYVISRREYVNLGSYRGIFQQYMLPKIRFNLYMVEDLHQNYLYIFAVDFVFSFFFEVSYT